MNKVPDYVPDKYKHKMFAMNMGVNGTEKSAEDVPSSDSSLLSFITHESVSTKALPNKLDSVDRVCRKCGVMQTIEVIQGQTPRCNMAGCLSTKLDFIPEDEAYFKPRIESTETIETEYDYMQYLEHLENTRRLGAQTSIEPVIDEHGKVVGTTVDFDYSGVRNLPSQIATAKAVASMKPCPSDCKREFDMFGRPHVCIVEEEKNSFVPKGYSSWQQYKKIQSFLNIWLSTPPTLFQRNVCKKHLGVDPTGFTEQQLTKHMKAYFWAKNNGKTELMAQKERIIKSNHEPVDNSLIWNIKEDYKPFAKRKDYDPINLDELDGWDSKKQMMSGEGESDIFGSVKYPTFVPNKYSRYNIKNDLLLTATMTGVKKNPKGEWVLDKDGKPVFKESKWAKTQTPSLSL